MTTEYNEPFHVEICQHVNSILSKEDIINAANNELMKWEEIPLDTIILSKHCSHQVLLEHVESIVVCSIKSNSSWELIRPSSDEFSLKYYVYRLTNEEAATEKIQNDSEELSVASHWLLPSKEFHHLWLNLYYDDDTKYNLLDYMETAMLFSKHGVNINIISWNKVVLLHGPPGTGKTSLCKALAQKIAIRLGNRFTHGELIEINSHSLFSKWFSESGKLVMKLFDEIRDLIQNEKTFVCILIDEVESLAHARKACNNGTEPSDSIRVVNALLTQLDQIKRYPNVLILTTSNMTEAIDLAFVDRADIKQYVGPPNEIATYYIYGSCLQELMKTGILHSHMLDKWYLIFSFEREKQTTAMSNYYSKLSQLSRESSGLTGRTLRKIPFLAHALYLNGRIEIPLEDFFKAMEKVIKRQKENSIDN